jgi:predicted nucleotidyltransferase
MTEPRNPILSGIVGSTAYGLAHADSDIDILGIFAAPTTDFHGLHRPKESHVTTKPDSTWHEAAKWCRLALACNPTAMELVWLTDHEAVTDLGEDLIGIRHAFLSARRVHDAYLGYATQQLRKLQARGDGTFSSDVRGRTAKHARHLVRLLQHGVELHQTGTLTIRLADPNRVQYLAGRLVADPSYGNELLRDAEFTFDAPGVLPEEPDTAAVERWLRAVRATYYRPEADQ